ILLILVFLTGPLARYFEKWDSWVGYRKEIGIVAGILALAHALITFVFYPTKSFAEYFSKDGLPALAGIVGVILLGALWVSSRNRVIELIGSRRWWFFQRWGLRVVIFLTVLHVVLLKYNGWMQWFMTGTAKGVVLIWMPPLSLLLILFVLWVILIRFYESIFLFRSVGFLQTTEITDPTLKRHGKKFVLYSGILFLIVVIFLFLRWVVF
ncbi:MAG TPA: ferric reductase-like transmembrane domain-containing protein, partial [Patescibacteria group bacterium]|nr:ferric reductase-like transmembrane domain-containing protein [Patescibacteria group bacterium]